MKKKIDEKFEKLKKKIIIDKDNFLVLVLLAMCIFSISINSGFDINDELWNFSNIYKMSIGYEIYGDLNVIITPMFFYIGELIFEIIGANYFVFRIYNSIIYTMLYYLIYKLFITLNVDKKIAKTYTALFFLSTSIMIAMGANYNVLSFNFVLIGIILYLKNINKNLKNSILQGIIVFLIFSTKQNIAVFYAISILVLRIININKIKIKQNIIGLTISGIVCIILILLYGSYLLLNNNLFNAINYTVLGISEFRNNIIIESIASIILVGILDILVVIFINSKKIKIEENIINNTKILIVFAFPMLFVAYPLFNKYHCAVAIIVSIITILYLFEATFIKELFLEKKYPNYFKKIVVISIIVLFFASIINFNNRTEYFRYENPYFGSRMKKEQYKYLNDICEYITKNDSIILSTKSNFFMNTLKKNNGIYDLPFIGNFGKGGEEYLVEKISNDESNIILIDNDIEFNKFHQNSKMGREYIKNNYRYIGEIENFLIYEK